MIHCIDCIHRKVCKNNAFTHPSQIIDGTCFDYKDCDVVPRSEYENLEFQFKELDIECDRLKKVETDFYEAVKQVKQEVAKKLTLQIRMAIMAHGTKYAMKELAKIEKEYMGE